MPLKDKIRHLRANKTLFHWKRERFRSFLVFLFFTTLLWIATQFSKKYTQEVRVKLVYDSIPSGQLMRPNSDQYLQMVLHGNGFRLLRYNWKQPKLQLQLKNAVRHTNGEYLFYIDKAALHLKNRLNFDGKVLSIQKDTVKLKLDKNLNRKIPIRSNISIKYANGYGSYRGISFEPDSVWVSGPEHLVNTITELWTTKQSLVDTQSYFQSKILLDTTGLPSQLTITPLYTTGSIQVSKFTQGSQKIPITIQHAPKHNRFAIFPKEVKVVYRVGLDRYHQVSKKDFEVVADYKKINSGSPYLILELTKTPPEIHDPRLLDRQVQFVILK